MAYRPGSYKAEMLAVYEKKGVQAAFEHGLKIGCALTTAKLAISIWEKRAGKPKPEFKLPKGYTPTERPKREKKVKEEKEGKSKGKLDKATESVIEKAQRRIRAQMERDRRKAANPTPKVKKEKVEGPITMSSKYKLTKVTYIKDEKEEMAYVIAQGPEQSLVRFKHNGKELCIPNNYLEGIPTDDGKRKAK